MAEKRQIGNVIAEYIRSELIGGCVIKPDFIKYAGIISNRESRVDIGLGESYTTHLHFSQPLLELIKKKEDRAICYRQAIDIDRLWLLIVIDDITGYSGFNLTTPFLPRIETSNFDCILLFERFNGFITPLFHQTL